MRFKTILLVLLVFIPLSLLAEWLHWGELAVFATSALAILPLAGFIGEATEEIAVVMGPSWGGLLNATFGNATELIIALFALQEGLVDVVKASITGSIISNLLLVMGVSMLLGGLKYKEQTFQPLMARINASAMNLAVIALLLPTTIDLTADLVDDPTIHVLSNAVAIVLIIVYGLSLLFSMRTHSYLYDVGVVDVGPVFPATSPVPLQPETVPALAEVFEETKPAPKDAEPVPKDAEPTPESPSRRRLWTWMGVLLVATLVTAVESEMLVDNLALATDQLGLTQLFTGVILLPLFGNAAEHASAVTVALKNKMDLSVSVAMGSSLQIALFVGPVLVLAGWFLNQPMDFDFGPLDLVAVGVAVLIANSISNDGRSHWLEGALLIAAYAVIALAFFFYPAP